MNQDNSVLDEIRTKKPLIHHITNNVTMMLLANGVLAAGGSPMMVHAEEEVAEAVAAAQSLVINIGTLTPSAARSMTEALMLAVQKGVPIVIDPVAVGMTKLRQNTLNDLLSASEGAMRTLCGNAAEIHFLAEKEWKGRGVDGEMNVRHLTNVAEKAAQQTGCLIVMTGVKDIISNGKKTIIIKSGHELMAKMTGTGCFASSLTALFLANSLTAKLCPVQKAARAMLMLGMCAEKAAQTSEGSGTFAVRLLDELCLLNGNDLEKRYDECVMERVI
ncbi:hydroxyethylthiazole kinase [Fictibacillus iocasae]|uniref:Hydroxyethylthiazole kinase n=1 Tax=Fictibacillus iocasae TaxID=2715437 RepID=A0ABW2NRP6_9BACL